MSQNTEQNVQVNALSLALQEDAWMATPAGEYAQEVIEKAEARGAAEEQAKAAEQNPVAWLIQDKSKGAPNRAHTPDHAVTDKSHADRAARFDFNVFPLYTHPANVPALEEEIGKLRTALQDVLKVYEAKASPWGNPAYSICRAALTREGGV